MEKVHWTQLQGNKYLQALHPAMLTDEGYKVEKLDRIGGMSRFHDKIALEVTFDRAYLIAYLEKAIFEKLHIAEWNHVQPIISEAWKAYRAKHKKEAS